MKIKANGVNKALMEFMDTYVSNGDLNDLKEPGSYVVENTMANFPVTGWGMRMLVIGSPAVSAQIGITADKIVFRLGTGNDWTAWREIASNPMEGG